MKFNWNNQDDVENLEVDTNVSDNYPWANTNVDVGSTSTVLVDKENRAADKKRCGNSAPRR